ncbi:MAG TPA: hypothetical protein VMT89_00535 [Candidatus Acidoferrales bacterium]|nr:hypothetical protein [Candidatus Acidoferrales bacterium]
MNADFQCTDIRTWAATYQGARFHALLCDPPYELGFMGLKWDKAGIAFDPEAWAALATCLLPGAFGFAFASSKGWHRVACAIEDAGLRMHPSVFMLGWAYGSGFPKATRLGEPFHEHRYGGQVLKPALEPILCFQKPHDTGERTRNSIHHNGTGALNVEAGRIGDAGRWPANIALVHSPECRFVGDATVAGKGHFPRARGSSTFARNSSESEERDVGEESVPQYDCVAGCPVRELDEQSGAAGAFAPVRGTEPSADGFSGPVYGSQKSRVGGGPFYGDAGGASRFFMNANWSAETEERIAGCASFLYEPKVDRDERNCGVSGEPKPLLWSSGTGNPGAFQSDSTDRSARNPHPTLKPIALSEWLAKLLLPPRVYAPRRLLVPFAGAGSEVIGAIRAGWDEVVAVEQDEASVRIAEERLRWWKAQGVQEALFS